jgi:putative nucleotidyltransferase with HDIG domain
MEGGLSRTEALELLRHHAKTEHLIKHCIATEAIMRRLAERLGEDAELWGLVGLLHDLDFDSTKETPDRHTLVTAEILAEQNVAGHLIDAIKGHNAEYLGYERKTPIEIALTCAETVTGMIVATALVRPDKRLEGVEPKSVKKKMKTKDFARAVKRERIAEHEKLGLDLDEFLDLSIRAMQEVSSDLGL